MCIICVKNKGVAMPTKEVIETMFINNSDGAGYMYFDGNEVVIKKGFMKVSSLLESIDSVNAGGLLNNKEVVLHFRIGTAGGNIPANTHPFPLTDRMGLLKKTRLACPIGVAHNGIISITPRDLHISDTMEYIASVMFPTNKLCHDYWKNPIGNKLLLDTTGSKLAIMDKTGVTTVGTFIEDEETGLLYSNRSYEKRVYSVSTYYSSNSLPLTLKVVEIPEECYIRTTKGSPVPCDYGSFFMTAYKTVYEFDWSTEELKYFGGTAYNPTGVPFDYNDDEAMYMNRGAY